MSGWWKRRPKCQHDWTEPREIDCVVEDFIAGTGRIEYERQCLRCGDRETGWASNV